MGTAQLPKAFVTVLGLRGCYNECHYPQDAVEAVAKMTVAMHWLCHVVSRFAVADNCGDVAWDCD